MNTQKTHASKKWGLVLALYLLGIFMGALDTGIVTPARTVIQNDLGVSETTGIWMITIYTLAYAAAIPVMGKLADRFGKKKLYIIAILLFGVGSVGCGIAQGFGSFSVLLVSRVVQALGGGGIVPIATAAVGVIVPPEKRGMALGLVGGVYGVANVFGASAGSLILNIAGVDNWQWIFYINAPIALFVVIAGIAALPQDDATEPKKIDYFGIMLMVIIVTALLWVIQHVDFFNLGETIRDVNVWGALLVCVIAVPLFVWLELRADDPVIDLRYFATREVAITMLLGALSGVILMVLVFVPQFAENSMRLPTGDGGYPVIILGVASGVGAPLSGKFTDKFGPRAVITFGVSVSLIAALVLNFWAVPHPGYASAITSLVLMGLGLGFLVGAPLNYLIMQLVPSSQATSGLANLSLVRSFGTTLAPAILVGLLANSMGGLQDTLMDELPKSVTVGELPHAAELQDRFEEIESTPQLAQKLGDVEIPDLTQTTYDLDFSGADGGMELPAELTNKLKTADVTTIVDRSVDVANYMFDQQAPKRIEAIQGGIAQGISGVEEGKQQLEGALAALQAQGAPPAATAGLTASLANMNETITWMRELSDAVPASFEEGKANYEADLRAHGAELERTFQLELNKGFANIFWFYAAAAIVMLLLLLGVPSKKRIDEKAAGTEASA